MTVARYPKNVFWSDEDGGFIAIAPDLPGCSAFGQTESEALSELTPAIDAWIEAAQKAGNPVPVPSTPATETYSGKFLLRTSKSLHRELAQSAEFEGVSLNQYVVSLLSERNALVKVAHLMTQQDASPPPPMASWHLFIGGAPLGAGQAIRANPFETPNIIKTITLNDRRTIEHA